MRGTDTAPLRAKYGDEYIVPFLRIRPRAQAEGADAGSPHSFVSSGEEGNHLAALGRTQGVAR